MPVIVVHNAFGLEAEGQYLDQASAAKHRGRKQAMAAALQRAVVGVEGLGVDDENDVLVSLPDGTAVPSHVTFVDVCVLFGKKERTRKVRQALAAALKEAATRCYEGAGAEYVVEVAVRVFDRSRDTYL